MLLLAAAAANAAATVENVRIWSENGKTRVVLDLSQPVQHNIFTLRGPDRLVCLDLTPKDPQCDEAEQPDTAN